MDSYRQIENLIYRYAELLDAGDLAAVAALFADAEFYSADGTLRATGSEQFYAVQSAAVRLHSDCGTPRTKHMTSNLIIDVDEEAGTACSKSNFVVFQATDKLPLQAIIAGQYRDRFEKVAGVWRFSRRQTIPELLGDLSQHLLFDIRA